MGLLIQKLNNSKCTPLHEAQDDPKSQTPSNWSNPWTLHISVTSRSKLTHSGEDHESKVASIKMHFFERYLAEKPKN